MITILVSLMVLPFVMTFSPMVAVITIVGKVVSINSVLLAAKELVAPGLAKVNVAALRAASLIVPLFNANELVPV